MAACETFTTPGLVTTRRSILGPPAEGRPGPSDDDDDDENILMTMFCATRPWPAFGQRA